MVHRINQQIREEPPEEAAEQPGSGFMVEYVMQANPRTSPDEPVVWGPHIAEIVMQVCQQQTSM